MRIVSIPSPDRTARFWAKVHKTDSCWLWTASTRNKGYGAFAYVHEGQTINDRAHRYSWVLHYGAIPVGLFVCHRCDNPACVHPDHLFLGTNTDNVRDMHAKERSNAKLTKADVREVRRLAATGLTHKQIAAMYGVSEACVCHTVSRRNWSTVE